MITMTQKREYGLSEVFVLPFGLSVYREIRVPRNSSVDLPTTIIIIFTSVFRVYRKVRRPPYVGSRGASAPCTPYMQSAGGARINRSAETVSVRRHADMFGGRRSRLPSSSAVTPRTDAPSPPLRGGKAAAVAPPIPSDPLTSCLDANGTYICTAFNPRCYIIQKVRRTIWMRSRG